MNCRWTKYEFAPGEPVWVVKQAPGYPGYVAGIGVVIATDPRGKVPVLIVWIGRSGELFVDTTQTYLRVLDLDRV